MVIDTYDSFVDFFNDFDSSMTKDLGNLKAKEITQKISNSNAIRKLSESLIKSKKLYSGQTVIEAVMSSRHFMFSRKEVLLYASILSLAKILNDAAHQEIRFSDDGMLEVARQILVQAGKI